MSYRQVLSPEVASRLYHGDSRVVLPELPACSVDSIVTDPPAGISFMNKDFDSPDTYGVEAKSDRDKFIGFLRQIMAEGFRILKPGGYGLVWSIPRTSHWTAAALEQAGFEIRDCVYHVFGCLSEDTEILTERGWEPYQTLVEGRLALCYDAEHGTFKWDPIQQVYVYPYKDTAYRLRGDHTDQVVSRNHRCLVERDGSTVFEYAESLQRQESVPVLEDVLSLLRAVPLPDKGTSCSQQDLLAQVLEQEHQCSKPRAENASCDVQGVRGLVSTQEQRFNSSGSVLHNEVRSSDTGGRSQDSCSSQGYRPSWAQGVDGNLSCVLPGKDDGCVEPSLEGRRHILLEARELRVGEVREVPVGVPTDGPEGRVHRGAQVGRGAGIGAMSHTVGDGASSQPRSDGQSSAESLAVRLEQGSQVVRGTRHTRSDLVVVEPIQYEGRVWCVRVPTGSFIARRTGKAFVTGNSGFPKSLNIGKAIAKMNLPEEAKKWEGWGTSLKPAVECWWLIRKPLDAKSITAQALATGTGGINIDGTRVKHSSAADFAKHKEQVDRIKEKGGQWGDSWKNSSDLAGASDVTTAGRWPSNVVLSHGPECEEVGVGDDAVYACQPGCPVRTMNEQGATAKNGDTEGASRFFANFTPSYTVPFFYTGKASKKDKNPDDLTAEVRRLLKAADDKAAADMKCSNCGLMNHGEERCSCEEPNWADPEWEDTSKAKGDNAHPTVKSQALMKYLVRLVTPKGGVVLDPFTGSGSTLIAAITEGATFVGVERDDDYVKIAQIRIEPVLDRVSSAESQAARVELVDLLEQD